MPDHNSISPEAASRLRTLRHCAAEQFGRLLRQVVAYLIAQALREWLR